MRGASAHIMGALRRPGAGVRGAQRVYLGPTSMDAEMAFIMCNLAQARAPPRVPRHATTCRLGGMGPAWRARAHPRLPCASSVHAGRPGAARRRSAAARQKPSPDLP